MGVLMDIYNNLKADYDATAALEKLAKLGYEPCVIYANGWWAAPSVISESPKSNVTLTVVSFHILKKDLCPTITDAVLELIDYYIKLDGDE